MATRTIDTEITLKGEREFNQQMKAVSSNLKTLRSDMALVTSEFTGNANSIDALRAKQEVLQRQYDQQREKVRALTAMMEDARKTLGEDSAEYDKYRTQVNNATVQLNSFGRDLEQTNQYLGEAQKSTDGTAKSIDEFGKAVKQSDDQTSKFGQAIQTAMGNLIADGIKGDLTAVRDRISALSDAIKNAPVEYVKALATAVGDLGKAIYDQTISSAAYADNILTLANNTGLSTDALQEYQYMAQLVDTDVSTITGSLAKLTRSMSSARDGTGSAADAFARLGVSVTDETGSLRDNDDVFADLLDALGQIEPGAERDALAMEIFGKSAQDLNTLIGIGSEGLQEFRDEAHAAGAVLSEDTLTSLGAVDDAFQRFNGALGSVKTAIGAEFAEPVEQILTGLTMVIQGNTEDGLDMITGALDNATQILDELIPRAEEFLTDLIQRFADRLPELLTTGISLITTLINGIAQTLPQLVPQMVSAITLMVQTLTQSGSLQQITKAAVDLIVQLALGLAKAIPDLVPVILDAITTIVTTLWDNRGQLLEAGKDLIRGLWEGITSMGSWLIDMIGGWASGIIDGFKTAFGIASPSRVMREQVGRHIGTGAAYGIEDGFDDVLPDVLRGVQDDLDTSFKLTPNVRLARGIRTGTGAASGTERIGGSPTQSGSTGKPTQIITYVQIDKKTVGKAVSEYQADERRSRQ